MSITCVHMYMWARSEFWTKIYAISYIRGMREQDVYMCVRVWCSLDMFEYGFHEEWIKTIQWRFVHSRTSPMFVRWNRQKSTRNVCVQLNVIFEWAHANKEFVCICISRLSVWMYTKMEWKHIKRTQAHLMGFICMASDVWWCAYVNDENDTISLKKAPRIDTNKQPHKYTDTKEEGNTSALASFNHIWSLCAHTDSHTITCFYTRTHLHGNPFW